MSARPTHHWRLWPIAATCIGLAALAPAQPDSRIIRVSKNTAAQQDGVHYNSIQGAIDSITTTTDPVVILIMPGEYDEAVVLDEANVSLVGATRGSVVLTRAAGVPLTVNVTASVTSPVVLDSLVIETTSTGGAALAVSGWNAGSGSSLTVSNCDLYAADGAALTNSAVEGLGITGSHLQGQNEVLTSTLVWATSNFDISNSLVSLSPHATSSSYAISVDDGGFQLEAVRFVANGSSTGEIRGFDVPTTGTRLLKAVSFADSYDRAFDSGDEAAVAHSFSEDAAFVWGDSVVFLDAGALAWRGNWSASPSPGYIANDIVFHSGSSWICLTDSTSEEPSGSATDWDLVAQKGDTGATGDPGLNWRGPWSASPSPVYSINDAVSHNGSTWICLTTSTSQTPSGSATGWDLFAESGGITAEGTGTDSILIGPSADSSDSETIAIGESATASYRKDIAIGSDSTSNAGYSIAIGHYASAADTAPDSADYGRIAIGYQAKADASTGYGIAIGANSNALEQDAVAIGRDAEASSSGVALGRGATVSVDDNYGIAIGLYANVDSTSGSSGIAIGRSASAIHNGSVAIGPYSETTAGDQIRLGVATAAAGPKVVSIPGKLEVEGQAYFDEVISLSNAAGYIPSVGPLIWAESGEIRVKDSSGTSTQISSHADPRRVSPGAMTSFSDSSVELPFSIHHSNELIGRGAMIDVTKAIAWIERQMIADLGEQAGRLTYVYDLPKDRVTDIEEFETERILAELDQLPWMEVPLGPGNRLPAEAWESVEIMETVVSEVSRTTTVVNWETMIVETRTETFEEDREVGTGRFEKRLRDGYRFEDGRLYRRPTLEDLLASKALENEVLERAALPDWIRMRVGKK